MDASDDGAAAVDRDQVNVGVHVGPARVDRDRHLGRLVVAERVDVDPVAGQVLGQIHVPGAEGLPVVPQIVVVVELEAALGEGE